MNSSGESPGIGIRAPHPGHTTMSPGRLFAVSTCCPQPHNMKFAIVTPRLALGIVPLK
jgi:hypothetical protein